MLVLTFVYFYVVSSKYDIEIVWCCKDKHLNKIPECYLVNVLRHNQEYFTYLVMIIIKRMREGPGGNL